MTRVWRLIAWIAGLAVVVALITPLVTTSLTNKPGDKDALDTSRGGHGKHGGSDEPIPVLTAAARQADVPVYVEGVGTGQALNSVLIRSQVDGTLTALNFVEGQNVKAGDVVARIDPRLYQAALDQNVAKKALDEATLANARRDLDRYATLVRSKAATQQQYDTQLATVTQNQAQVAIDQALIDSAKTTLSYTDIVSPISGRTGLRKVDVGNLIHASDTGGIVTVSQIQPISVVFNLPQQDLGRVNAASASKQLDVQATDANGANVVDHGTLEVVDNTIDQTTGTVKLKANFPNAKLQLWPGIFVNVRLLVETLHGAVVVPVAALQRGPNGAFVFGVSGDKAAMRPVQVSEQDDTQAVLKSGVAAGDAVITSGFQKLTDGARVKASPDTNGGPSPPSGAALHEQGVTPPPPNSQGTLSRRQGGRARQSASE